MTKHLPPYAELCAAARAIGENMYRYRLRAGAANP